MNEDDMTANEIEAWSKMWDVLASTDMVTGGWSGSPWEDLPDTTKIEFMEIAEGIYSIMEDYLA